MGRPSVTHEKRMKEKGFVTCAEAGRRCGVDRSTVTRWLKAAKLEPISVGATTYVSWQSVLNHLGPEGVKALGLDGVAQPKAAPTQKPQKKAPKPKAKPASKAKAEKPSKPRAPARTQDPAPSSMETYDALDLQVEPAPWPTSREGT